MITATLALSQNYLKNTDDNSQNTDSLWDLSFRQFDYQHKLPAIQVGNLYKHSKGNMINKQEVMFCNEVTRMLFPRWMMMVGNSCANALAGLAPGVMAHWYSPFWDLETTKRSWVQTQRCAGETPAGPLPMSLTWGCQQLVSLGLLLCF